jgi:hypothetical protein
MLIMKKMAQPVHGFKNLKQVYILCKVLSVWSLGRSMAHMLCGLILVGAHFEAMALNPIQTENAIPAVAADYNWNVFPAPANPIPLYTSLKIG